MNNYFDYTGREDTEKIIKTHNWRNIDNQLRFTLGIKATENFNLGFRLIGGSDIGDENYTSSSINFLKSEYENKNASGAEIEKVTSSYLTGSGFMGLFGGIKLKSGIFKEKLEQMSLRAGLIVKIGDGGLNALSYGGTHSTNSYINAASTTEPVITQSSPVDGGSFELSGERANGTEIDSKGDFKYVQFNIPIWAEMSIPLHKHIYSFSMLDTFSLILTLTLDTEFRPYYLYDAYDKTDNEDKKWTVSIAYRNSYLIVPECAFLLKPINPVSLKIGYYPRLRFENTYINYTHEDGNQSDSQEGTYWTIPMSHNIYANSRIRFPKVVALELGAHYSIGFVLYSTKQIYDTETTTSTRNYDQFTGITFHNVNPYLRINIKLVETKGTTVEIEPEWSPNLAFTNTSMSDTNILNLANWKFSLTIDFDPKALGKPMSKPNPRKKQKK